MILKTLGIRNVIIAALILIIFFLLDGCSRVGKLFESEEVVGTKTTTTIKYDVKWNKFEELQPFPDIFKPTKVYIKNDNDGVKEIPEGEPIPEDAEEVNKYIGTANLPNGLIDYEFLIRGELLSTNFRLSTSDTTITKETLTEITKVKSILFYFGGTTLGFDGRVKDIQAGVTYVRKANWYIETGLQYDVDPLIELPISKRAGILLKVGFKF